MMGQIQPISKYTQQKHIISLYSVAELHYDGANEAHISSPFKLDVKKYLFIFMFFPFSL